MNSLISLFRSLQLFFITIDTLLFGVFVYSFIQLLKFRPNLSISIQKRESGVTLSRVVLKEKWDKVTAKFNQGTHDAMRLAIIEADHFIDGILKDAGLEGEHMADRLDKLAPDEYASLNLLWRSHRIRNQLVHEDFTLTSQIAEQAIYGYEAFLREINVFGE